MKSITEKLRAAYADTDSIKDCVVSEVYRTLENETCWDVNFISITDIGDELVIAISEALGIPDFRL